MALILYVAVSASQKVISKRGSIRDKKKARPCNSQSVRLTVHVVRLVSWVIIHSGK
jgi:hypothetical protein